jgi:hypothetical protein
MKTEIHVKTQYARKTITKIISVAAVLGASVGLTFGTVIMDDEGVGFAGKGDVQKLFEWNNKQLQAAVPNIVFRAAVESGTTIWQCRNSHNGNIQTRSTESSTLKLLHSDARVNNQITGFNLNGLGETLESVTTGQTVGNCPSGADWSLVVGSIQPASGTSTVRLEVSGDGGTTWTDLPIDPIIVEETE